MTEKVSSILAKQITFCTALLKQILVSVTETAKCHVCGISKIDMVTMFIMLENSTDCSNL